MTNITGIGQTTKIISLHHQMMVTTTEDTTIAHLSTVEENDTGTSVTADADANKLKDLSVFFPV